MSAVVFRSGSREDFENIDPSDIDQSTLYFMNTNGDFDPHGMCDDGDLYLGGALIGVSRAEKAQIDASIAALENANSMTTDASVWFIGADSSSMEGWSLDYSESGKRKYVKDVSLGEFINSDKLQFNAMLMIENTMNTGNIIAEIFIEMGHYVLPEGLGTLTWELSQIPAGNPFGTQVRVPYILTKSSDKGFTTANLSGLMIGPFPPNHIIRMVVSVPTGVVLTVRNSTPESYRTNASQLIVQKFGNGS